MRKRIACGRTEADCYKSCMNSDFTWKSNRLVLTRLQFYRNKKNKLRMRIHYKLVCRKCGHTRQSGNCFDWSVIRQLITGDIWF